MPILVVDGCKHTTYSLTVHDSSISIWLGTLKNFFPDSTINPFFNDQAPGVKNIKLVKV